MKTQFIMWTAASLLLLSAITMSAQDTKYHNAMAKAMSAMAEAKNDKDFVKASAAFERIMESADNADAKYWPRYYAAFNLITANWLTADLSQRDALLDKAIQFIEPMLKERPGDDEFETLRGYALMGKLVVDPQQRGQMYSPMVFESLGKAMGTNPNNPRAMTLMARQKLGSSQFFGSKPDEACALASKSVPLYEAEKHEGYAPRWGLDMAQEVIAACK